MAEGIKIESQFLRPGLSPFKSETYFLSVLDLLYPRALYPALVLTAQWETGVRNAHDPSITQAEVDMTCKRPGYCGFILLGYFLSLPHSTPQAPCLLSCGSVLPAKRTSKAPLEYSLLAAGRTCDKSKMINTRSRSEWTLDTDITSGLGTSRNIVTW